MNDKLKELQLEQLHIDLEAINKALAGAQGIKIFLHPKGEFKKGVSYRLGDIVMHNGKTYAAMEDTTEAPTNDKHWQAIDFRGPEGKPGKDGADGKSIKGNDGAPGARGKDGTDGQDGREVEFRATATHIQWRYRGTTTWFNLIALNSLKGEPGEKGKDGKELELRVFAGFIEWHVKGEKSWRKLINLEELRGKQGIPGRNGAGGGGSSESGGPGGPVADTDVTVDDTDFRALTGDTVYGANVHELFYNLIVAFSATIGDIFTTFGTVFSALSDKQDTSEKGQANGYGQLDENARQPRSEQTQNTMNVIGSWSAGSDGVQFNDGRSNINLAGYTAELGDVLRVRTAGNTYNPPGISGHTYAVDDIIYYDGAWHHLYNSDPATKLNASLKGAASGVAELDGGGKVPAAQLPSYVDDVVEAADFASLPGTGETGKIYVTLDTNKTYRWTGTIYTEVSQGVQLGETSTTAYRGDRGKTAYDHSQDTATNPHNVTKAQIGLSNVTNDAQLKASDLDTDGTLAANSDTKIASQKAIVTYARKRIGASTGKVNGFSVRDMRILGDAYLSGTATTTPSTNRWTFEFYNVTEPITLDRVAIEVTTAGAAGKLARLALYTADEYWQPQTLVQDFGTVATDVGAVPTMQTITINLTLQPGRYVGIMIQDGAAAFRTITGFGLAYNALNASPGTTPYRNIASLNGVGTVASGFASVSPRWERDVYSAGGGAAYMLRYREAA